MPEENRKEIKWVYGMKAWGAFSVVMLHMLACMFPAVQNAETQVFPGTNTFNFIQLSPINIFFNGSFAVYVFWTLSGFLFTNSFLNQVETSNNTELCRKTVSKFLRIFIMVFLITTISFVLLKCGCYYHIQAGGMINNSFWINERDYSGFGFQQYIEEVFCTDWRGQSGFIPPLWTMRYELLGSILVCALLATGQVHNNALMIFLSVMFLMISAPLVCFLSGILIASFYYKQRGNRINKQRNRNSFPNYGAFLFLFGIIMGAYPATGEPANGIYKIVYTYIIMPINTVIPGGSGIHLWYIIAAALMIIGTMMSPFIQKALSKRLLISIGKVSMFTYLCHIPILWTFVAWLYYTLESSGKSDHVKTIVLCYLLGLLVIYGCSYLFMLLYNKVLKKFVYKSVKCLLPKY